jgi:hypothetical protein
VEEIERNFGNISIQMKSIVLFVEEIILEEISEKVVVEIRFSEMKNIMLDNRDSILLKEE